MDEKAQGRFKPLPSSETELVVRATRGDGEAFAALVEPYQKRLYNLAFRMTGHREEAADIVQDSLLRAYTSLKSFHAQAAFGTWLYKVATNVCLDALRRRKRQPEISAKPPAGGEGQGEDPSPAWERRQSIQKAVTGLPPELRAAVVLRDIQGFAYEEIAAILGLTPENVKTRIHRGRALLRQRFQELELLPSVEGRTASK